MDLNPTVPRLSTMFATTESKEQSSQRMDVAVDVHLKRCYPVEKHAFRKQSWH
jgi:hypothetical protein